MLGLSPFDRPNPCLIQCSNLAGPGYYPKDTQLDCLLHHKKFDIQADHVNKYISDRIFLLRTQNPFGFGPTQLSQTHSSSSPQPFVSLFDKTQNPYAQQHSLSKSGLFTARSNRPNSGISRSRYQYQKPHTTFTTTDKEQSYQLPLRDNPYQRASPNFFQRPYNPSDPPLSRDEDALLNAINADLGQFSAYNSINRTLYNKFNPMMEQNQSPNYLFQGLLAEFDSYSKQYANYSTNAGHPPIPQPPSHPQTTTKPNLGGLVQNMFQVSQQQAQQRQRLQMATQLFKRAQNQEQASELLQILKNSNERQMNQQLSKFMQRIEEAENNQRLIDLMQNVSNRARQQQLASLINQIDDKNKAQQVATIIGNSQQNRYDRQLRDFFQHITNERQAEQISRLLYEASRRQLDQAEYNIVRNALQRQNQLQQNSILNAQQRQRANREFQLIRGAAQRGKIQTSLANQIINAKTESQLMHFMQQIQTQQQMREVISQVAQTDDHNLLKFVTQHSIQRQFYRNPQQIMTRLQNSELNSHQIQQINSNLLRIFAPPNYQAPYSLIQANQVPSSRRVDMYMGQLLNIIINKSSPNTTHKHIFKTLKQFQRTQSASRERGIEVQGKYYHQIDMVEPL